MSAFKAINVVLFVLAGLFSIIFFMYGITEGGMSLREAIWFSCGVFLGIIVTAYLAVAAIIVVCAAFFWLLGKLIVIFILGGVAGIIGGLYNIFGG